ncbi:MAG: DUF1566 domain-containing protein [Candidatus Saccharibacteria bacterium]
MIKNSGCAIQPSPDNDRCLKGNFSADISKSTKSNPTSNLTGSADSFSISVSIGSDTFIASPGSPTATPYTASNFSTQLYPDNNSGGTVTAATNGVDNTKWVTVSDSIGSEKKDTITGLIWSSLLYKNTSNVVVFSSTANTGFSWNNTSTYNLFGTNNRKSAIELCAERGNGWRLPTQKEIIQAYIDGSYFNLNQASSDLWSMTQDSGGVNSWAVTTSNGASFSYTQNGGSSLRCVRSSGDTGMVGICPNQAYQDNYGLPVTDSSNCIKNWVAPADNVAGSEKRDPISGLTWSSRIVGTPPSVGFSGTAGFTSPTVSSWKWSAQVSPAKTAAQLCSERNNGWRIPTQKELLQAYVDGSYRNLSDPANDYWSATSFSTTNANFVNLGNGASNNRLKTTLSSVRCVR